MHTTHIDIKNDFSITEDAAYDICEYFTVLVILSCTCTWIWEERKHNLAWWQEAFMEGPWSTVLHVPLHSTLAKSRFNCNGGRRRRRPDALYSMRLKDLPCDYFTWKLSKSLRSLLLCSFFTSTSFVFILFSANLSTSKVSTFTQSLRLNVTLGGSAERCMK